MDTITQEGLQPGKKYRIQSLIPTVQRVPREHVLKYLGPGGYDNQSLIFSFRPQGGDQEFPPGHILAMWEVDPRTELFMNRKVRGEKRVF